MKIIFASDEDILGCAKAAVAALRHGTPEGGLLGLRIENKYYGVKWNKNSITVHPQH